MPSRVAHYIVTIVVAVGLSAAACIAQSQPPTLKLASTHADAPPASLDAFYPPRSSGPVYLMRMYELNTALTGIMVNLSEKDFANVKKYYSQFKTLYAELAPMVPEWAQFFPTQPVEELGIAIAGGSPTAVMGAAHNVGALCGSCHAQQMTAVQFKYHWPDFRAISLQDPQTKEDVPFQQFMLAVNMTFTGIGLKEGQPDAARALYKGFRARFQTLAESCTACHESERRYFTDASIMGLIDELGSALESPSPNATLVGELERKIGTESCFKCHLVHVPAALAKARWSQ